MPDLTADLLPRLETNLLPGLNLGDGFIYPDYNGGSILNIPDSLCQLFGIPELSGKPLRIEILSPLLDSEPVRRVILVLMDALSFHRLQRWTQGHGLGETAPVWQQIAHDGLLTPLTSIVPSTTSAAITSLWTGRGAAEHGVAGYELWLKEYGVVANMIAQSPMTFRNSTGSLAQAGFDPEKYLPFTTLGTHFAAHGIKTYALQHHSIVHSGLSKMFFRDVNVQAFSTPSDLWVNARHLLETHPEERLYAWVYWGELDHLSHFYGPDDERSVAEFASFSTAFERLFLNRLSPELRRGTLVLLTADHGQINTLKSSNYDLNRHPEFTRRLHLQPTGENRMAYLYLRPGQYEEMTAYLNSTWPDQFTLINPLEAVAAGLFGPGKPHPRLLDRLGDVIAVARGSAYWWWADKENRLHGRHGGLSPEEMLVPLIAGRL
jgi:Type I phosphodiesterase / nucleotide pyrophosphatase